MSVLDRVKAAEPAVGTVAPSRSPVRLQEARGQLKAALVERLGLATIAGMLSGDEGPRVRAELAVALEAILNTQGYEGLLPEEREECVRRVVDEVCGLGPIQPLLEDDDITEVMINGCDALFYERDGELYAADAVFDSPEQIMIVIDRILAPLGRRLDRASPIVSARLSNGDRVNAVATPVAIDGPVVTIRKFSDRIRTLGRLVELEALPQWFATLLSWAVRARRSIAVAGGTGSGKTTLLNALSCEIPVDERIVTIEDSAELKFSRHPHVVRLEARPPSIEGEGAVTIRDLVTNALRMRPDRIVVGEVRGAECIDMLQAMNTGHDGSLTTLHAGTEEEAVVRLTLLARYGINLPSELIEEQIAMALDGIVMSERRSDGRRFVSSYSGVTRSEAGGVRLERFVTFDSAAGAWELVREPPFIEEALRAHVLTEEEVEAWRGSCPL